MISSQRKTEKRSPIKRSPLRTAGQSLEEHIHRIQTESISPYVALMVCMLVMASLEWWRWYRDIPLNPVVFSICALLLAAFCHFKIRSIKKDVNRLKMAKDGEKAVGEFLDVKFREKGYRVFHDIIGGDFNLDHVMIGPAGVFTIETKTVSKTKHGKHEIIYDGEKVKINGYEPPRNPIIQAKAQSTWIRELINDLMGQKISVQPVVLYPGWFCRQPSGAYVWVLSPKALPAFIDQKENILLPKEVSSIATHLSRYVRTPDTLL